MYKRVFHYFISMQVESSSRFLSLNCVLINKRRNCKAGFSEINKTRSEFHNFVENVIKTGNTEAKNYKSQVS